MRWTKVEGSPWVIRERASPRLRLRLVCFPYAGGGASIFRGWHEAMPEDVEVVLVQPPGRESRLLEPPFRRLEPLAVALRASLDPLLDVPYSFFGHSMGAFIAFEVACDRMRRGLALPEHLFVSASRAPHVDDDEPPIYTLSDDAFVEKLRSRYGGIPLEVLQSPELMELVLPNLKADLELVETHRHDPNAPHLSSAMVAFAGTADEKVPPTHLARWQELVSGSFRLHTIEGGHFFLSSNRAQVLALLADELRRWLDGRGSGNAPAPGAAQA